MQDLGVQEAALILDVHENSIRNMARRGLLPDRRDKNGNRVFLLSEILEFKRREREGQRIGNRIAKLNVILSSKVHYGKRIYRN